MRKTYTHLTAEDRDVIAVLRSEGRSLRKVAEAIGRDPGTLSRELRRNAPPVHVGYYLPHKAQERAERRNCESHRRPRLKEERVRRFVERKLRSGWSPELIAGRLPTWFPSLSVSHEAIYQWVYAEARHLISFLVRHHRRRFPRGHSRKHRKPHIPNRVSISERPAGARHRSETGHWETDTAGSRKSRAALQVSVERRARYAKLAGLPSREAREMRVALNRRLSRYPRRVRKSITYDNGSENVEHERVNAVLGTRSYFCEPYHSWEKGTVENTIGLVRRFLPKTTDFATISGKDLRKIERWLNNRPRKCLNFKTPAEVFRESVALTG